jgi:predicted CXXCH cytochrome family protein
VTPRDSAFFASSAILATLLACGGGVPKETSGGNKPKSLLHNPASWAGSDSCRECHPGEWTAWSQSNHSQAEKILEQTRSVTATNKKGQQVEFDSTHSIGVEPLVQFVIEENGRGQVAQRAWDPKKGEWFDIFSDGRQPGEWGHWTGRGMNWNSMCARCHNTGFEKNWNAETDSYASKVQEHGVGCESCHGPGKQHVLDNGETILGKASDVVEACAPCHSRRGELTETSHPHDRFLDSFLPELPGLSETWHADGQIKDEDYEWASFRLSRMAEAGVTCLDCHDPHSSRTKLQGDSLCMSCHAETQGEIPPIRPEGHTHHLPESDGSRCISCHMPTTIYMQRDPRHDHSFGVPDPYLTKKLGVPNACNSCHGDQSVEWAHSFTEKWYGDNMDRPRRKRATLLHDARVGKAGGWSPILAHLKQETHSTWRAVLTGALEAWPNIPEVRGALFAALSDEEELVRLQAIRALGPTLLETYSVRNRPLRYFDSYKGIRVEAARSLGPYLDQSSDSAKELLEFLTHNRDQPPGAAAWSTWLRDSQQPEEAIAELLRARTWDTQSPALDIALASAFDAANKPGEALKILEKSVIANPDHARLWFLLGLARAAAKSSQNGSQSALHAMEKSLALDSEQAQPWYNLGILYLQRSQYQQARQALEKALELNPENQNAQRALQGIPKQ